MSSVFDRTEKYVRQYVKKWGEIRPIYAEIPTYSREYKKHKNKLLEGSISGIFRLINDFPKKEAEKQRRISELKALVENSAIAHLGIRSPDLKNEMLDGIMDVTDKFFAQAKDFDSSLKAIDIMQAMRNVWIMNMIQILAGIPVQYTPAIFAYSMLYPYTDNFLDDPNITLGEKQQFNKRLSRRLKGEYLNPLNALEEKAFSLVAMIEWQFPRQQYKDVFDSILAIQEGQIKSLTQQTGLTMAETKILRISAEKGGTSVLADAYLVCGNLDETMFEFAMGFGFILQLVDDLQDAASDCTMSHCTMFSSRVAQKRKLDDVAQKLILFVTQELNYDTIADTHIKREIMRIITENCLLMIFEAVSKNQQLFSKQFLKFAQEHSQLSMSQFIRANKKIKRKMRSIQSSRLL